MFDNEFEFPVDEPSYINPFQKSLEDLQESIRRRSKTPDEIVLNTFALLEKMADTIAKQQSEISKLKHARHE